MKTSEEDEIFRKNIGSLFQLTIINIWRCNKDNISEVQIATFALRSLSNGFLCCADGMKERHKSIVYNLLCSVDFLLAILDTMEYNLVNPISDKLIVKH